jgi:hypothetical protein
MEEARSDAGVSGQSTVDSRQCGCSYVGFLINPFRALATSPSRSFVPGSSNPRFSARSIQCSVSYREPRAMKRNLRRSGPCHRPIPSAMFAPIESAARTSCTPRLQRSNESHRDATECIESATSTASRYAASWRKSLLTPGEAASPKPSPLSTVDCRLST